MLTFGQKHGCTCEFERTNFGDAQSRDRTFRGQKSAKKGQILTGIFWCKVLNG